ncbi:MAG: TIR domain-containing protein, partial [Clostridia bacterium]|nr:TIR domain-containing protein [Clostridia bacterium]
PEDIPGGSDYSEQIPVAITNCKALVLIYSQKAESSKWVRREVDQAINRDKIVLPFMIEKFEMSEQFKFYLTNVQCYMAYEDMSGQLMQMTKDIMAIPGITIIKPEEKKPEPAKTAPEPKPQPAELKEPDFAGLGLRTESQKIRYAVNEGKAIYDNNASTPEERNKAFEYLRWAASKNDAEACYHFGRNMLVGRIRVKADNTTDRGMYYLDRAARLGYKKAQEEMDNFCRFRYRKLHGDKIPVQNPAPLRDFDGWKIKIKHKGKFMPVNAELVWRDNENILFIDVKYNVITSEDEVVDRDALIQAVEAGMQKWEGVYSVFGGQKLTVVITPHFHEYSVLGVINIFSSKSDTMKNAIKIRGIYGQTSQNKLLDAANRNSSFSVMSMKKWSVRSFKNIIIDNPTGRFDNYSEITRAVAHEFGAILGLETMGNIPKGTYPELDPYYISDGRYNLVMSNVRGIISDNDMEMVLLALSENEKQYYSEDEEGHKPSKALGRGN